MIYNFNHGMGWASSGVEYAQSYRASIFRKIGAEAKFIFTDMFSTDNIEHLSKNLGFLDEEIIWLYTFFTDVKIAPTTFTLDDLKISFEDEYVFTRNGNICRFDMPGTNNYYKVFMVNENTDYVHRVEIVRDGYLIRKDYYNYCKMYSEYYAPANNEAHLYQRSFFNEDGSLAYEEIIDGKSVIYKFEDCIIFSKERLIERMVQRLNLNKDDVVIIDRSAELGAAVLHNANDAKVGVVIHADHFSEGATDEENILWNNYYEYTFSQYKRINFYIAATEVQSRLFKEQFEKYYGKEVDVVTIPVGSIDYLKYPERPRKKLGLITASRLASEKHVDWLVGAVAEVHKEYPDITLDIYGKGPEADRIKSIIDKNDAQNYIRLMGHRKLDDIYKEYQAYISASTSEGFGLTLLEAIGSGLPIIGFDVRYGNPTFVSHGQNGFLVEYNSKMSSQEKIDLLANAIKKLLMEDDESFSKKSYEIASKFMTNEVEKAWKNLLGVK